MNFIIAIDGYSACGKSTLAKALAKRIGFIYIDSGAMYRAATLYFIINEVDKKIESEVLNALDHIRIEFKNENEQNLVFLNDEDVTEAIRLMVVSEKVSKVSSIKAVRKAMTKRQQEMGQSENIIMDGRDIGVTVFPFAQLKLFMTADPIIRTKRRYEELIRKGQQITPDQVYANLQERDHDDCTREESPLTKAEDSILLDTSFLTESQQLDFAYQAYQGAIKKLKIKG